jgi:hypothetical protein
MKGKFGIADNPLSVIGFQLSAIVAVKFIVANSSAYLHKLNYRVPKTEMPISITGQ